MFEVNIKKELSQKRDKTIKNQEVIVDSAKLLMAADSAKERDLLRQIGIDNQIVVLDSYEK